MRLYQPEWIISDVSGDALDPAESLAGMKVETSSMTDQQVGKPLREWEAKQLCKQYSIKPISCRWGEQSED